MEAAEKMYGALSNIILAFPFCILPSVSVILAGYFLLFLFSPEGRIIFCIRIRPQRLKPQLL